MLGERSVKPENLPADEDTKKLKRKLDSDDKELLKEVKQKPKKKK